MFAQRYGVPMQDGYQKSQPDAGRFNFQDRMAGGPGMRLGQLMAGHPMTGGNHPAMQMPGGITPGMGGQLPAQGYMPQTGGQLPPQQFQPMTGGALQAQSGYPMPQPQGLAAMFRGYSPYRYG